MQIDGTEQVEELDSVLGELGEVFVDHVERALKHILHDYGHLVFHEVLVVKSAFERESNAHIMFPDRTYSKL